MEFKRNVEKSFSRLKKDMNDFKESLNSWVLLLKRDQTDLRIRVIELERKIRILESEGLIRLEK